MRSPTHPHPGHQQDSSSSWALGHALALTVWLSIGVVLPAIVVAPACAAEARSAAAAHTARVTLTQVAVKGSTITIAGRVTLPANTAKERKRAVVWLTLTSVAGTARQSETFTAKLNGKDRFNATHTTRLTGALGLGALVKIGGKVSGKKAIDTVDVAASSKTESTGTTGSTSPGSSSSGSTSSGTTSSGSSPSGSESQTQPSDLVGTFELEAGREASGTVTGSWFEMFDPPEHTTPLPNGNSPLKNHDYTPLSAGTDGGLQTFAYQPGPTPAFSKEGNALADEIVQPQEFQAVNFSVVTGETDPQTAEADPKPQIVDDNGQLSGQITAWAVGWNNQWFNQGSPKPDGTFPEGTTALSGTYDAATGHYVLEWKSLIVGGPFKTFAGAWHLEGTFVPSG